MQLPRLLLKSCRALERGNPWDAIRTYIPFVNERRPHICYFANSDGTPRVLSVGTTVNGGSTNNSVESCTAACFASGFPLAGVEYSDECCTLIYFDFLRGFYLIGPFSLKTALMLSVAMAHRRQPPTATWSARGAQESSVVGLSA